MACRGFWEYLLKLFNFLFTLAGLAMVGYGVYLLLEWNRISSGDEGGDEPISPSGDVPEFLKLGRPMLLAASFSSDFLDKLPKAWFIYLFIGLGAILLLISFFGFIGAVTRNGCCLSSYSFLLIVLILVELGAAAVIFFDQSWKEWIPMDKTGNFDMMYDFLEKNWKITKWAALGVVIFEVVVFLLALLVRALNIPVEFDSDDEYIAPRADIGQPLIKEEGAPATGVPASAAMDQRPGRADPWSQRMREKYGLDTSNFTYNRPSDSNRYEQLTADPEERGRCSIL